MQQSRGQTDQKPTNRWISIFRTKLGNSNEILEGFKKVVNSLNRRKMPCSEETSLYSCYTVSANNSNTSKMQGFRSNTQTIKNPHERSSNYFKVSKAKLREDCLGPYPSELKSKKLSQIRQADVHFSLQRLALMVKIYMEEHSEAAIENIYMHILLAYLDKLGICKSEADELVCNIRRRICEVLRVLDGLGVISLERKIVSLTPVGELQGKGLFRESRRRLEAYEDKKKEFITMIQKRDELHKKIKMLQALKTRNRGLLALSDKEEGKLDPEEQLYELPMTFIAGPPVQRLTIFQLPEVDPFKSVQVDKQSGRIRIQGDNLRVVQMEDVLSFLSIS